MTKEMYPSLPHLSSSVRVLSLQQAEYFKGIHELDHMFFMNIPKMQLVYTASWKCAFLSRLRSLFLLPNHAKLFCGWLTYNGQKWEQVMPFACRHTRERAMPKPQRVSWLCFSGNSCCSTWLFWETPRTADTSATKGEISTQYTFSFHCMKWEICSGKSNGVIQFQKRNISWRGHSHYSPSSRSIGLSRTQMHFCLFKKNQNWVFCASNITENSLQKAKHKTAKVR